MVIVRREDACGKFDILVISFVFDQKSRITLMIVSRPSSGVGSISPMNIETYLEE
jgi:hypothetical protein